MCQQCKTFLDDVRSLNHDKIAICALINNSRWYHYTRDNNVNSIIGNGLKLGRDISRNGQWNSHFGDGISLCASDCWNLQSSGDKLFMVRLNVSNPLYDVYSQTAFDKKEYSTRTSFYQDQVIVGGYFGAISKSLPANIERTNRLLAEGFDALLFEENQHAVLVFLHGIETSNIEFIG